MKCRKYKGCEMAGDECIEAGDFAYRDCLYVTRDENLKIAEDSDDEPRGFFSQLFCADLD